MKKNEECLRHALHNEEVCKYLELRKDFPDWIITTAFYTALQFLHYKIFPFEKHYKNGVTRHFDTLESYHKFLNLKSIGKHELLVELTQEYCPKVWRQYKWLLDLSKKARYRSYQQDILEAQKAVSDMKVIKNECLR